MTERAGDAGGDGCRGIARGGFAVPAGHPALAGHFPGRPIAPGVVLLDECLRLALPAGARLASLPGVKFLGEVGPDERVEVVSSEPLSGRVAFSARVGARAVLRGSAEILP